MYACMELQNFRNISVNVLIVQDLGGDGIVVPVATPTRAMLQYWQRWSSVKQSAGHAYGIFTKMTQMIPNKCG